MQGTDQSMDITKAEKDDVPGAIEEINRARLAKDLETGERLTLALANRHPDDPDVQLKVFNLLHRMGRWETMLDVFETAKARGMLEVSPSVRVLEAEAHLRLGRHDIAKSILIQLDRTRIAGVAAKRLPTIEALFPTPHPTSDAEVSSPSEGSAITSETEVGAPLVKQQGETLREAPLEMAKEDLDKLLSDPIEAIEQARLLRLERRAVAATQLLMSIIQHHPADRLTVANSLHALHRSGSYREVLEVLARSEIAGIAEQPDIAVLRADCLMQAGAQARAEAKEIIIGVKAQEVKGVVRHIWQRLRKDLVQRSRDPNIRAIEDAFMEGNTLKGATLFRALLDECRQFVAATPQSRRPPEAPGDGAGEETDAAVFAESARDVEHAAYSRDFEAATGGSSARRKVLVISDSIALPRQSTGVGLQESYPYLLHNKISQHDEEFGVVPDCRRGRTILDALNVIERQDSRFDTIILQVGIVDCTPRIFGVSDVRAVRAAMGDDAANSMIEIAGMYRPALVGDRYNSVYVRAEKFSEALDSFLTKAASISDNVIVVDIVTPSKRGGKLTGTPLDRNISDYNDIMKRSSEKFGAQFSGVDEYIWSQDNPSECFTLDNYHYNSEGHKHCANLLSDVVTGRA